MPLKSVRTFSVRVPLFQEIFTPYDPMFWHIFFANMGVGVVEIVLRIARCQWPAKRQKDKPCETKALFSPTSHCWWSEISLESA